MKSSLACLEKCDILIKNETGGSFMKVLLLNGSPHEHGCTDTALREMEQVFAAELDLSALDEIRATINVYRDRRPQLYQIG